MAPPKPINFQTYNMLELKSSAINGVGLFTKTAINKNTRIVDYTGIEMSLKEFREKYGEYKNNSLNTYRMKRLNRIIVAKEEPYKSNNLINFINESNNPNCILKKRALYSLREILPEEELTLLYLKDYYRNYIL